MSHDSPPTIIPSPQLGTQAPLALGAYPLVEQVRQTVADEQVLHDPGQATHPLVASKYCPTAQLMGLSTSC